MSDEVKRGSATPGPWHLVPAAEMADCAGLGPTSGVFSDDDGAPDDLIGTFLRDDDGRLAAAAPALLAELIDVRAQFFTGVEMIGWRGRMLRSIDAAIAKATGEKE